MPAAAESELRLGVSPSLDEVRALAARGHNLVPVIQTYLEDCETPVSAFLKLRGAGPAFLLESAEQGQRVGIRLAQRLHRADQVVAEEADRAARERRRLGERRLAEGADLGRGQRVGVARVAQRPAHDLARAHADEAEAPDALALLGGLQQEGGELRIAPAQLQEGADRGLEVVDEAVAQRDEVVLAGQRAHFVERRLDAQELGLRATHPISGDGH